MCVINPVGSPFDNLFYSSCFQFEKAVLFCVQNQYAYVFSSQMEGGAHTPLQCLTSLAYFKFGNALQMFSKYAILLKFFIFLRTLANIYILRWSETKSLEILIIDKFFSCYVMVMKLCTVTEHGKCMIKIFRGGRGGDTFKTPSPLRTTFAFTHPVLRCF